MVRTSQANYLGPRPPVHICICERNVQSTWNQQNLSTAFHPRTDRQTECMNTWIEQYLHPWTSGKPNAWSQLLPVAKFAHNLWKHDVAHKSPHELLIGIKPQVILKHLESSTLAAEQRLRLLDDARQSAQKLLQHVQSCKNNR